MVAKLTKKEILKKVSESTVGGGGNNIRDGRGRLAIKKLALEEGYNGTRFVAEFIVVSANKVPVVELKTNKALDVEPNPVGSEVSYVQMLDKHASAMGNMKGFILTLFGEAETSNDELLEVMTRITGNADNPADNVSCFGRVIDFDTFRKITDEKKVEIVIPKWKHVPQTEEDIAAMKMWLDALFSQQTQQAQPAVIAPA